MARSLKRRLEERRRSHARKRTAGAIEKLLADAEHPPTPISSSVPFDGEAVIAAREELEQLAGALRCRASVREPGVQRAERLLADYESPICKPGQGDAVRDAARAALAAL